MYLDAIQDAAHYADRADAINQTREQAEQQYAEIIKDAFIKDVQTVSNVSVLHVPYISYRNNATGKFASQPLSEAVADQIAEKAAHDKLMEILQDSPCHLVQQLREIMANHYADQWVSELAEFAA